MTKLKTLLEISIVSAFSFLLVVAFLTVVSGGDFLQLARVITNTCEVKND
ncbi:hypothetical protein NIES23_64300 (plasmid) [Trichormus variabilis NIES-23]|uniref:Uncharacterized protein n=1 Tax=Trichormus variabilis NIES-23 TaxID=1973479 RepID=A0A1Z4KXD7_ANAVA|nr:hypothetical protein NIES23_64300 [Trichormus variabilis NIES-23]